MQSKLLSKFDPKDVSSESILNAVRSVCGASPTPPTINDEVNKTESVEYKSILSRLDCIISELDDLGIDHDIDTTFYARCRSCGESTAIFCEPEDFDLGMNYCGKNPYCMP